MFLWRLKTFQIFGYSKTLNTGREMLLHSPVLPLTSSMHNFDYEKADEELRKEENSAQNVTVLLKVFCNNCK